MAAVMGFVYGCVGSDCTNNTYISCKDLIKPDKLVITTPDGRLTFYDVSVGVGPSHTEDPAFLQPQSCQGISFAISGTYPDNDFYQPGRYTVGIDVDFDHWSTDDVIALTDTKRVTDFWAYAYYTGSSPGSKDYYELDPGTITAGTLKVLEVRPEIIHIQINGLKFSGVPTRGEYKGKTIVWSISPIDYVCKPTKKTLCQDGGNPNPLN